MSTSGPVLFELGCELPSTHRLAPRASGRAAAAAVYPPQLRRAILRGVDAQRRLAGQAVPPQALAELA
eukprot:10106296-Alexandrium_andersonii.AAC.1